MSETLAERLLFAALFSQIFIAAPLAYWLARGLGREEPGAGSAWWKKTLLALCFLWVAVLPASLELGPLSGPEYLYARRGGNYILATIPAAVAFHLSVHLLQRFLRRRWLRLGAGFFKWAFAPLFPFMVMGWVEDEVLARGERMLARDLAPLVASVKESCARGACPSDVLESLPPGARALNLYYCTRKGDFLLYTKIGSIDIDGARFFLHPKRPGWRYVHNDELRPDLPNRSPDADFLLKADVLDPGGCRRYVRDEQGWRRAPDRPFW